MNYVFLGLTAAAGVSVYNLYGWDYMFIFLVPLMLLNNISNRLGLLLDVFDTEEEDEE